MGVFSGPELVTDGLILNLMPFSAKNTKLASSSFLTNGAFAGGANVTQVNIAGSNPTNEIVKMNNPGDSDYVLRQYGANYPEYEINLGAEMVASTTYVMSGWYAKSLDFNGTETMFHARAHSTSGAHIATGPETGTALFTKVVDGITWTYRYQTITTPSDYNNVFAWFVGYGNPNAHNGYRYYTNLKVEKGTFPSLVDLSGNNNHHYYSGSLSYANEKFTTDGSTSAIVRDSQMNNIGTNCTVVLWYSTSDTQELWVHGNDNAYYLSASASDNYYHGNCGSPTNYVDLAATVRPDTPINYRNGAYHMWEAKGVNFSGWTRYGWFGTYPGGWQMAGSAAVILVYNRSLTAAESAQNYYALRGRFGI